MRPCSCTTDTLPGAKEMTERRAAIRYAYVQTEKGGRVDM